MKNLEVTLSCSTMSLSYTTASCACRISLYGLEDECPGASTVKCFNMPGKVKTPIKRGVFFDSLKSMDSIEPEKAR